MRTQPADWAGTVSDVQEFPLRIDDKRRGLQDVAFFFVPAAQGFSGGRAVDSVEHRKSQLQLINRALRLVERIGREPVNRDVLRGGRLQVGLEIS